MCQILHTRRYAMRFVSFFIWLQLLCHVTYSTKGFNLRQSLDAMPIRQRKLRFKLYRKAEMFVAAQNEQKLTFTSEANKFALMTPAEIAQYHGVNRSHFIDDTITSAIYQPRQDVGIPLAISWIDKGHVTSVKNQDGCGACWTFGPVVAIEGMYKKITGKLKEFSNQELLDCVYDHITYNGCHGGRETRAFDFVIKRKRLGLWRQYPYEPRDSRCRSSGKINGLKAAMLKSFTLNDGSERSTIQRLAQGPLSVAFHAVLSIHYYKNGIYVDSKCGTTANHAVAAVAYTPSYILIKNSWGADWGLSGLFKFGRGNPACGIHLPDNNFFVELEATNKQDTDEEDAPLHFIDPDDPEPVPTENIPVTTKSVCYDKIESCLTIFCGMYSNYKEDCKKTCGFC